MKLTKDELRWLSRWEKNDRLWLPLTRWICVFGGVLSLVLGAWLVNEFRANGDPGPFLLIPLLFFVAAGILFGGAFSKWRGDVKLRLLVRLIREHEEKDA